MTIKEFLIERKNKLLIGEKLARGKAKQALIGQLQAIDSFLIFLSTPQQEDDMEKLQLSLDDQATPLEDLKISRKSGQIVEAIKELVATLKPGYAKPMNAPGISPRTVLTTVFTLKKKGILPPEILAISRNNGKEAYIGRAKTETNGKK